MKKIKQSDEQAIQELEETYGEPHMDLSHVLTQALTLEMMRRGHTNTYLVGMSDVYKLTVLQEDDSLWQTNGGGPAMIMEILD